jgi:hypothetical protein
MRTVTMSAVHILRLQLRHRKMGRRKNNIVAAAVSVCSAKVLGRQFVPAYTRGGQGDHHYN